MKNRLRVLRAERDWSQADLAERLGVSRQTVTRSRRRGTTRVCRSRSRSRTSSGNWLRKCSNPGRIC